jgi:hypothetical protein
VAGRVVGREWGRKKRITHMYREVKKRRNVARNR